MSFGTIAIFSGIIGLYSVHKSYKSYIEKQNIKLKNQCVEISNKLKENLPKYQKSDQLVYQYGNIVEIDENILQEILNTSSKRWFDIVDNYLIHYILSTLILFNNVTTILCYSGIYGSRMSNVCMGAPSNYIKILKQIKEKYIKYESQQIDIIRTYLVDHICNDNFAIISEYLSINK